MESCRLERVQCSRALQSCTARDLSQERLSGELRRLALASDASSRRLQYALRLPRPRFPRTSGPALYMYTAYARARAHNDLYHELENFTFMSISQNERSSRRKNVSPEAQLASARRADATWVSAKLIASPRPSRPTPKSSQQKDPHAGPGHLLGYLRVHTAFSITTTARPKPILPSPIFSECAVDIDFASERREGAQAVPGRLRAQAYHRLSPSSAPH